MANNCVNVCLQRMAIGRIYARVFKGVTFIDSPGTYTGWAKKWTVLGVDG